ncbi:DSPc-domain-containing protein, partial [Nadsonia fulvescens var. elongata DSM 6958]
YPNGPVLVISPYVYLYSEPTLAIASQFDVVINVAKEVSPLYSSRAMADINIAPPTIKQPEYYHIQWTHTSTLLNDLPQLCDLLLWRTQARKRILVHCQCGVSRSASLLVAFIMREQSLGLNEAYKLIKGASPVIGPNMRLIFQLVDW